MNLLSSLLLLTPCVPTASLPEADAPSAAGPAVAAEPIAPPAMTVPLEITPQDTKALLDKNKETVLIDCREQNEWDEVHIEAARLIPMSQFEDRLGELSEVGEKPLVIHCRSGRRSLTVVNYLRANGYPQAQSMSGGILQWIEEIDPSLGGE